MQRKKILWLVSWYPNRNDAFDGDFIQRHARAAAICHNIHVIFVTEAASKEDAGEQEHRATGLTEQIIYLKRTGGLFSRVRKALAWKNRFQKAVSDYINTHGRPDFVHVHVPWKAGLIALWLKQKYGLPFLVSEHWGFYGELDEHALSGKPSWMVRLLGQVYRQSAGLVTVSNYLAGLIERTMDKKAGWIIPNVVDTTLFFQQAEKYERFTFIHVSNMMPVKNVGGILQAFAQLVRTGAADIQLILVGNRDETYVEQARSLGLLNSSVFFRGEVPYVEVAEEMRRSHALVLFSQSETFSCVTAEALCCGLPVIATTAGALPELVDSFSGRLVPPGNIDALTEALRGIHQTHSSFSAPGIARSAARKWGYTPISEAFDNLYTGATPARSA